MFSVIDYSQLHKFQKLIFVLNLYLLMSFGKRFRNLTLNVMVHKMLCYDVGSIWYEVNAES